MKWDVNEIGIMDEKHKRATEVLAFPAEVDTIIQEAHRWKNSEEWYREKCIPWRRGWLLYGKPGTGKTSLVRAMGQDLGVPVVSFDLASMSNDEFALYWNRSLESVPCIVLFEDIDHVFKGRENKLGEMGGGLTFDCVLNCISGISNADGIFLVVTTNHIEDLDEALGAPRSHANGTLMSTRPGRIDRALELPLLDKACRTKIAQRILEDCSDKIDALVKAGDGDTGAQFQERCAQVALEHHWNSKA